MLVSLGRAPTWPLTKPGSDYSDRIGSDRITDRTSVFAFGAEELFWQKLLYSQTEWRVPLKIYTLMNWLYLNVEPASRFKNAVMAVGADCYGRSFQSLCISFFTVFQNTVRVLFLSIYLGFSCFSFTTHFQHAVKSGTLLAYFLGSWSFLEVDSWEPHNFCILEFSEFLSHCVPYLLFSSPNF